ncbi:unnamed protein product [Dracunculus medinensis]|uniref:ShKT domain-containing protein n=1 Tax=Dracunculus medinensis TaxID=318479 RepID=A0A0N4UQX3_DRAME|nr:unnamed protein product [Dracunculus medinensis]
MNFVYLPLLLVISCVSADDKTINEVKINICPYTCGFCDLPGAGGECPDSIDGCESLRGFCQLDSSRNMNLFFKGLSSKSDNAGNDVSIKVCNRPLPLPAAPVAAPPNGAPQPAQEAQYRPTVDPNLCFDLDPACSQVFNLEQPEQTIQDQRNP